MTEVILITKQLRMQWTDAMAVDAALSPTAFRVGCVIGSHLNKSSGDTFVKQETIADLLGVTKRTVQAAIGELEYRGWLIVERRQLGFRADGRMVCGGKGVANTYRPAFQRTKLVATNGNSKVAADCHLWQMQRWQSGASKVAAHCHPTLKNPSGSNPSRAGARANGPSTASRADRQQAAEWSKAQCLVYPGTPAFDAWLAYYAGRAPKMERYLSECMARDEPATVSAPMPPQARWLRKLAQPENQQDVRSSSEKLS